MCSNIGTPYNHHFPFGTNGKVVVLGVPILKHFRVMHLSIDFIFERVMALDVSALVRHGTMIAALLCFIIFFNRYNFSDFLYASPSDKSF